MTTHCKLRDVTIKQDWKGVRFGVQWHSRGVLHATSHSYCCINVIRGHCRTTVCPNSDLGHCCTNAVVAQQRVHNNISLYCYQILSTQLYWLPVFAQQCPWPCGLPTFKKKRDRQTDMEEPLKAHARPVVLKCGHWNFLCFILKCQIFPLRMFKTRWNA
jgi:hypothetical protein